MAKKIVKEIIIVLLLILAIMLVLGIILYEYNPVSKTLPNIVSYSTPEEAKKELAETGDVEEEQVIMTYEVDQTDLNNYKKIQGYKPGKANPFSSYETVNNTNENENTSNETTQNNKNNSSSQNSNTTNNNINNNTNNNTQENSSNEEGGKFFQNKGTK